MARYRVIRYDIVSHSAEVIGRPRLSWALGMDSRYPIVANLVTIVPFEFAAMEDDIPGFIFASVWRRCFRARRSFRSASWRKSGRFIHVLRGRQVVIDSDLALLCEVETKYLNGVANRHADRFSEDFRFQLEREEHESLRRQIVTSNDAESGRGGRRYRPSVYTE